MIKSLKEHVLKKTFSESKHKELQMKTSIEINGDIL